MGSSTGVLLPRGWFYFLKADYGLNALLNFESDLERQPSWDDCGRLAEVHEANL